MSALALPRVLQLINCALLYYSYVYVFLFPDRSCPGGDGGAAFNERVRCGFPAHWWALAEAAGATTAADAGASANTRPVQCLHPCFFARILVPHTRRITRVFNRP